MRLLVFALSLLCSLNSWAADREALLAAWEQLQASHEEVESFEKTGDGIYQVTFATLPFSGELRVLAYDLESLDFNRNDSPFTHLGYVELELVGFDEGELAKYGRTYARWAQHNQLYFNAETGQWLDNKRYLDSISTAYDDDAPSSFFLMVVEYWNYALIVIILYFLFSSMANNRRVRDSIALQHKALEDMTHSRQMMEKSMEAHRETNRLLRSIDEQLKR